MDIEKLAELQKLKDKGVLTKQEFEEQKALLMNSTKGKTMTETNLEQYPDFSRKLLSNPVRNGWIVGLISWVALFLINIVTNIDLSIIFLIGLIICYKIKKRKLANYKNPPKLDNLFKFYLNVGLSAFLLSCIITILLLGYITAL